MGFVWELRRLECKLGMGGPRHVEHGTYTEYEVTFCSKHVSFPGELAIGASV